MNDEFNKEANAMPINSEDKLAGYWKANVEKSLTDGDKSILEYKMYFDGKGNCVRRYKDITKKCRPDGGYECYPAEIILIGNYHLDGNLIYFDNDQLSYNDNELYLELNTLSEEEKTKVLDMFKEEECQNIAKAHCSSHLSGNIIYRGEQANHDNNHTMPKWKINVDANTLSFHDEMSSSDLTLDRSDEFSIEPGEKEMSVEDALIAGYLFFITELARDNGSVLRHMPVYVQKDSNSGKFTFEAREKDGKKFASVFTDIPMMRKHYPNGFSWYRLTVEKLISFIDVFDYFLFNPGDKNMFALSGLDIQNIIKGTWSLENYVHPAAQEKRRVNMSTPEFEIPSKSAEAENHQKGCMGIIALLVILSCLCSFL